MHVHYTVPSAVPALYGFSAEAADEPRCEAPAAYDVALVIRNVGCMRDVLQAVMELLAIDAEAARDLVCREPCVLLGAVSAATVSTLARRFCALNCELDVSTPRQARYDLLVIPAAGSAAAAADARRAFLDIGVELSDAPPGLLVAAGLDHEAADRARSYLQAQRVQGELRNRDFARADVVLERAGPDLRLQSLLVEPPVAIPARLLERVLSRLPVVVRRQAPLADAQALLQRFAACGAQGRAELRSGMRCRLVLERVGDAAATGKLMAWLGGLTSLECVSLLAGRETRSGRVYTPIHAQWLVQELAAAGTSASIELD